MAHARMKSQHPEISVPAQGEQVRLGRVGLIAAAGLAIGIAWPRLFGVHLVPAPPADSPRLAASASAPDGGTVAVNRAAVEGVSATPPALSATAPENDAVKPPAVSLVQVANCRDSDGNKVKPCTAPSFDQRIQAKLQSLVACDAASGARGTLSVGFDVDASSSTLDRFTVGKSTTLSSSVSKQLMRCAEKELTQLKLAGSSDTAVKFRLFYKVEFGSEAPAPTEASGSEANRTDDSSTGELVSASGRVTVTWDAALVRSRPKDGDILARVLGGTRLTVTGRQGDWYKVKYDAKGSEGWVFRAAIGFK